MTYSVLFRSGAKKDLRRIPAALRKRIEEALAILKSDPTPNGCRKLFGYENCYRLRVGDYRIIYELAVEIRIVEVARIRDRKEAYRGL